MVGSFGRKKNTSWVLLKIEDGGYDPATRRIGLEPLRFTIKLAS